MADATVRLFPYSFSGDKLVNGTCVNANWEKTEHDFAEGPGVFASGPIGILITPSGGESLMIPES